MATRYKLKLKRLDFISAVDQPAQETATALLLKRAGDMSGFARAVKRDDDLGLVFCWAFTSKAAGADYYDLHGDCIDTSGPDFIRVCAEFMEGARAVDDLHDGNTIGKTVFGMPMTPEIAKAYFGIEVDTAGLMVAIKPSAEVYAKFKSGEYAGVSIAGIGEREVVSKSERVLKGSLYTNEVDGHQHTIRIYDDGECATSYATSEGADSGHSHSVVRGADGSLEILADSGHTHELAEGQPALVIVDADAIVVVANSATPLKSTATPAAPTVKTSPATSTETIMANESDKTIADLTKRAERAERIAKMTGAQKSHYDTLSGDDAEAFVAKSNAERESEIAKALEDDKPVWTGEVTKVEVRKRDGALALQLAKANEDNAKALAKREDEIEKSEIASIAKSHMGNLAGDDDVHAYVIKAVRKGGGDAALVEKTLTAIKGWNAGGVAKGAPGFNPEDSPQASSLEGQLETLAVKYAADHKVDIVKARGLVLDTAEGAALYGQIEKRKQAARTGASA